MALSAQEITILLKAKDEASGVVQRAQQQITGLGGAASIAGKALAVGLAAGAVGVAAGLGAAVSAATEFEKTMSGVKAVSGGTGAEMADLSALALKLGKDTAFSASEAAAGIEELVKGGLTIPDIMQGAATATLNLAAAGGVSLPEAALIASNALNQFSLKGQDMAHVSDLIAGAANASAIDVNQFGLALQQSGAVAATIGFNFDDLSQAIAIMGKAGIAGSDAGTSLKTMMLNLTPSTKQATAEMKALGIITAEGANQFFDAQGKVRSMADVAGVLQTALAGMSEQQKLVALNTLFGSDAIRAGAVLAKAGAAGFDEMAASMGKVSAASVGAERLNNLAGDMEQLHGSLETAAITLGQAFMPALRDLAQFATSATNAAIPLVAAFGPQLVSAVHDGSDALQGILKWFGQNRDILIPLAAVLAGAAAGFVALQVASTAAQAIQAARLAMIALNAAMVANPVGLVVAAIGALVAAAIYAYNTFPAFREAVDQAFSVAKQVIVALWDAAQPILAALGTAMQAVALVAQKALSGDIKGAFEDVLLFVTDALPKLGKQLEAWGAAFVQWVVNTWPVLLVELGSLLTRLGDWVVEVAPKIVTTLLEWGKSFVQWVVPMTATLFIELLKLQLAIMGWIKDRALDLGLKLVTEWVPAFLGWIVTDLVPKIGPAMGALLDAIGTWVSGTAVPWAEENMPKLGAAMVRVIGEGFSALGDALKLVWEGLDFTAGPVHFNGKTGFSWVGASLQIPLPSFGGSGPALPQVPDVPAIASSGMAAAAALAQKTAAQGAAATQYIWGGAQGRSQMPNIFTGGDCSGFVAWIYNQATGKNLPAYVADLVDGKITQKIDRSASLPGDLAIFNPGGAPDEQHVGIVSQAGGGKMIDESTATGGGVQVRNVGASAQFYRVLGAAAKDAAPLIRELGAQIDAVGSVVNESVPPITDYGLLIQSIGDYTSPAGDKLDALALATGKPRGAFLELAESAQTHLGATADAATSFASQFGISLSAADKIIQDHGAIAKAVLATDIPGSFAKTDLAVEEFAAAFGINWDQARAILESSGKVSELVMGTQIPAAAQATVTAVNAIGDNAMWQTIDSNAAIAGRSLVKYLQETGASAIDVAAASLVDLEKASGLTLPQIQTQAAAAGKDIKLWLQDTGVPAAKALAKSLGAEGVAGAADAVKKPISDATNVTGDLGGKMGEVAANQATQIAAVLLDLRDGLLGIGKHSEGGLIQGVKDLVAALGSIPTDVKVNITTNQVAGALAGVAGATPAQFAQSGIAEGSNRNAPSSGGNISPFPGHIGESGPGGRYNDPTTGKPYTRAGGGPVSAGTLYRVNEGGTELFMPSMNGYVAPHGAGGGSGGGGVDYGRIMDRLDRMVKALESMPAPRVAVEDIRSSLASIGLRNGGVVGLA